MRKNWIVFLVGALVCAGFARADILIDSFKKGDPGVIALAYPKAKSSGWKVDKNLGDSALGGKRRLFAKLNGDVESKDAIEARFDAKRPSLLIDVRLETKNDKAIAMLDYIAPEPLNLNSDDEFEIMMSATLDPELKGLMVITVEDSKGRDSQQSRPIDSGELQDIELDELSDGADLSDIVNISIGFAFMIEKDVTSIGALRLHKFEIDQ